MSRLVQVPEQDRSIVMALHAMWPLLERSSRFGLYFWLGLVVYLVAYSVVLAVTDSFLFAFAFGVCAYWAIRPAAKQAGIERELYRWADKVEHREASL